MNRGYWAIIRTLLILMAIGASLAGLSGCEERAEIAKTLEAAESQAVLWSNSSGLEPLAGRSTRRVVESSDPGGSAGCLPAACSALL